MTSNHFPAPEPESSVLGPRARLRALAEAVLFVSADPVSLSQLARALGEPGELVRGLIEELQTEFEGPGHGLRIRSVAGGYQLVTKPEHHDDLRELLEDLPPPTPLSQAALETVAIIAFEQPVTAAEVQRIRGVRNNDPLRTLLKRKLITVAGRSPLRGHPLRYRTTNRFLVEFGLQSLDELKSIDELHHCPRATVTG